MKANQRIYGNKWWKLNTKSEETEKWKGFKKIYWWKKVGLCKKRREKLIMFVWQAHKKSQKKSQRIRWFRQTRVTNEIRETHDEVSSNRESGRQKKQSTLQTIGI